MPVVSSIVASLPRGLPLDDDVWEARHKAIRVILVVAAVALGIGSLAKGLGVVHSLAESVPVALFGVASGPMLVTRRLRSSAATVGLFTACALVVHVTEGSIESHFSFFVMVGVIALYQDWLPFLLGVAFVVFEHGVLGVLDPETVYAHQAAFDRPWIWAVIHGAWLLSACGAHVVSWRLHEQAVASDRLTGLANREHLNQLLDEAPAVVVAIDLQGFGSVNDRLGHETGDRLLVAAAGRLRACAGPDDVVGRVGPDDFVVLVRGGDVDALDLAHRAVRMLGTPYALADGELEVPAVAGVGRTLAQADLALHAAKRSVDGVVVFREQMHADVVGRARLEDDLRRAIADGGLALHYQPEVSLLTGEVVAVEALARWQHPERGWVPPLEFVPLAEDRGLIGDLGRWALAEATQQVERWRRTGRPVVVAVNVSPVQLQEPRFVADVAAALARARVPGEALVLELTERVFVLDHDATAATIDELHRLGVRIAIDDFGTGYSSLSYLARLAVDVLKVDRTFTAELVGGGPAAAITRAVVGMSAELGLEVVAEGVEDEATADALRALGCDVGQGWHFGRPAPAQELTPLLLRPTAPARRR